MLNFLFIRVYTKLTSIFIVAADRISQRRSNTKSLVGRVLSACRTRIRSVYLIVDAGGLRSYLLSCRAVTSHRRISFFFFSPCTRRWKCKSCKEICWIEISSILKRSNRSLLRWRLLLRVDPASTTTTAPSRILFDPWRETVIRKLRRARSIPFR